ncbi:MAG: rhomboid family intramembrane serine protease [Culturomica sp.]|jgi:membrane associated rhomboid family serine protease|nr:rhomboid family intramembrane serine protease [Culturomica sp.]
MHGHLWRIIGQGIKASFLKGSTLTRLVYLNIGVFLCIQIVRVVLVLFGFTGGVEQLLPEYMGVPADPAELLYRPWTLFTYMFTHFGFLHLLFNMLWLYWFGTLFLNHFSQRELTGVYLLGGLCGALLYVTAYNVFPAFEAYRYQSWAIGASASVMAVVFAVCLYLPQYRIDVFLIGQVRLIYLALFTVAIDLLGIPSSNAGGHIAHLGGALFGCFFVIGVRRNRNITKRFVDFVEKTGRLFSRNRRVKPIPKRNVSEMSDREYNSYKKHKSDQVNRILDKISRSGYDSLTREEKEILFKSDQ